MTAQFAISHFRERAAEQALPQISRAVLNEVAGLVEVLLAENERLKADKERLDWLETRPVNLENLTRNGVDAAMRGEYDKA